MFLDCPNYRSCRRLLVQPKACLPGLEALLLPSCGMLSKSVHHPQFPHLWSRYRSYEHMGEEHSAQLQTH